MHAEKSTFLGLMSNYFAILTREFNHTDKVLKFYSIKNLLIEHCILIVIVSWKNIFRSYNGLIP